MAKTLRPVETLRDHLLVPYADKTGKAVQSARPGCFVAALAASSRPWLPRRGPSLGFGVALRDPCPAAPAPAVAEADRRSRRVLAVLEQSFPYSGECRGTAYPPRVFSYPGAIAPGMSVVTRSVCSVGSGRSTSSAAHRVQYIECRAPSVAASLTEAFNKGSSHATKQDGDAGPG